MRDACSATVEVGLVSANMFADDGEGLLIRVLQQG